MAQESDNVVVGFEGAVYVAPIGSSAPTDASAALSAEWSELGFVSDAGVTITHAEETTDLKAWQRATVVRKLTTSSDITYKFSLIETNAPVAEFYYKKALNAGGMGLSEGAAPAKKVAMVLDVVDGTNIHRHYLSTSEVTERGDQTVVTEDAVQYDVTVTAYESNLVKVEHFWDAALPGSQPVPIAGVTVPSAGLIWTFDPLNAALPADLAALKADTAVGDAGTNQASRTFTTGEYIAIASGVQCSWNGTAWVAGAAA